MSWFAVGSAAASVVGGAIAKNQANKAAKGASNAITQAQQQQYEQTREDLAPYRDFGAGAIPLLQQLAGGDYSAFENSPDYKYALSSGLDSIDHRAAARGGLFGGGNTRDAMTFASGLASQNLNNYRGSLFNQAQMGQGAAAQTGQFGANAANNIGNAKAGYYQQVGQNNADFATGTAGALGGLFNNYMAGKAPTARQSSYAAPANYIGAGGQPTLGLQQPTFGNNYGNFGNWGWSR